MSFSLYNLDYELTDKNATDFITKAILYDWNDLNKLVIAGNEKINHFISKAIMFYILSELNHDVVAECNVIGIGRLDLYDLTTKVIYEFETTGCKSVQQRVNNIYKQTGFEIIVIDVRELPDDIFQRYLKLKEYVIPD